MLAAGIELFPAGKDAGVAYIIGTDEAGYGPSLGPLVISATLWRVPDGAVDGCLYQLLKKSVTALPRKSKRPDRRVWLADSKVVYSTATGLGALERNVRAALACCNVEAHTLHGLLEALDAGCCEHTTTLPWHAGADFDLPLACALDEIDETTATLRNGLAAAGVELLAIRSRVVFPEEFNSSVERLDNKSTLLTQESLRLVRRMLDQCEAGEVRVFCDKHGGRNTYAPALSEHVFDGLVQVVREAKAESVYRISDADRRVEIGFRVGGESSLAVALASMTCKYVRETSMHAWNTFWQSQLPGITPTAGYTTDAARFRRDIADKVAALAWPETLWWRRR